MRRLLWPTSTPVSTSGGSATPTRPKTQIHIVVQLGRDDGIVHSTDYYDIGIDGSDPHPLHFQVPCVDFLSITQDGRWGVCLTHQGIATFRVLPGFPSTTLPEEHVILPIDSQFGYSDLSWDPTGRYLAIARFSLSDAPTAPLDIFAVSPQHDQARLVVRISGAFALSSAQWSPDGKWLAIDTMTTAHSTAQGYVIPLWQSVSPLPAFDAPAEYITITMAQLVKAPYGSLWRSGYPAMLTEITNSGLVSQYEVATGHTQVIGDMVFPPESYEIAGILRDHLDDGQPISDLRLVRSRRWRLPGIAAQALRL